MEKLHPKAVWLFFLRYCFIWLILSFFLGTFLMFFLLPTMLFQTFNPFFQWVSTGNENIQIQGPSKPLSWIFSRLPILFNQFSLIWFFIIVIGSYIWARLSYKYYGYELTDSAVKVEYGVIYKRYVSIPYERIQNVDIYRGILDRLLGLSDIQIQTAGYGAVGGRGARGWGAEGRLPALDPKRAEELREELIKRAKGASGEL
jgi:uncharacterized membrane protein YdbT with pleckstrin-like domain